MKYKTFILIEFQRFIETNVEQHGAVKRGLPCLLMKDSVNKVKLERAQLVSSKPKNKQNDNILSKANKRSFIPPSSGIGSTIRTPRQLLSCFKKSKSEPKFQLIWDPPYFEIRSPPNLQNSAINLPFKAKSSLRSWRKRAKSVHQRTCLPPLVQ